MWNATTLWPPRPHSACIARTRLPLAHRFVPRRPSWSVLMALVEEASLGKLANLPEPTATRNADQWVDADVAGIPQREITPQPWTPRSPKPAPVPQTI